MKQIKFILFALLFFGNFLFAQRTVKQTIDDSIRKNNGGAITARALNFVLTKINDSVPKVDTSKLLYKDNNASQQNGGFNLNGKLNLDSITLLHNINSGWKFASFDNASNANKLVLFASYINSGKIFFKTGGGAVALNNGATGGSNNNDSPGWGVLDSNQNTNKYSTYFFGGKNGTGMLGYLNSGVNYSFNFYRDGRSVFLWDSIGNIKQIQPSGSFTTYGIDNYANALPIGNLSKIYKQLADSMYSPISVRGGYVNINDTFSMLNNHSVPWSSIYNTKNIAINNGNSSISANYYNSIEFTKGNSVSSHNLTNNLILGRNLIYFDSAGQVYSRSAYVGNSGYISMGKGTIFAAYYNYTKAGSLLGVPRFVWSVDSSGIISSYNVDNYQGDYGSLFGPYSKVDKNYTDSAIAANSYNTIYAGGNLTQRRILGFNSIFNVVDNGTNGRTDVNMYQSSSTTNGWLSSTDWNRFNSKLDVTAVESGSYTPLFTGSSGLTPSASYDFRYMRVGNEVTVHGRILLDMTSSSASNTNISLPIGMANNGIYQDGRVSGSFVAYNGTIQKNCIVMNDGFGHAYLNILSPASSQHIEGELTFIYTIQ